MATLNLKSALNVRFQNMEDAKKYGADATVIKLRAGSTIVPDELMEHPYVKAAHIAPKVPRAAVHQLKNESAAPKGDEGKSKDDDGKSKDTDPLKPVDDMSYQELKDEYEQRKGEPAANNVKKADLAETVRALRKG